MSIPFDLEAAQRGEPIQYRNGTPAKFVAFEPEARWPVVTVIDGYITTRHADGRAKHSGEESPYDIVMAPRKRTVWVTVYPGGSAYWYDNVADADKSAFDSRIGGRAYPLEITE